jgi:hypothetical protein
VTKEIIKGVVIALVVAAVLAVGAAMTKGYLISFLGGVTKEDLANEISNVKGIVEKRKIIWQAPSETASTFGGPERIDLGNHEICALSTVSAQINNGKTDCVISKTGESWIMTASVTGADAIARCQAVCGSYKP